MTWLIYLGAFLLLLSLVAYLLGARGMAGVTAELGRTILIIGVILFVILLLIGLFTGRGP